jgi:hypothetical protein
MQTISSIDLTTMSGAMRQLSNEEMAFVSGGGGFPGNPYIRHHHHDCHANGGELVAWTIGGAVGGGWLGAAGGLIGDALSQMANGACGKT